MKKYLVFMLAAAFMASCQQNEVTEGTTSGSDNKVTISPVITRATETSFENGDVVGLTITKSDGTVYATNEAMTFSNGAFSGNVIWYAEGTEESTLTAYYPRANDGVPSSFTVQTDQNTNNGYEASDFLAANKTNVVPSTNAVTMVFKHMFTKLLLNVENECGSDISSIVLQGSVPTADIDYSTLTVTANANAAATDITTQQVTANEVYRAIIVPQEVAFNVVVTTVDGKTLEQKLISTTLAQGGQYSVSIRVLQNDLQVLLSGEITDWTNEGEISADNSVAFEEHLDENYFLYDGERYQTVTLSNGTTWMAENMRYLPAGVTPSSDPTADSHVWYPYELNYAQAVEDNAVATNLDAKYVIPLTDEASIKKYGYLYDMSVIFGKEVTPDNYKTLEDAQGICPKGWHVPNRAEYYDLIGASNANVPAGEASGNKTNSNALFWGTDATGKTYGMISKAVEQWGFQFSGARFWSPTATRYQLTVAHPGNTTKTDWYGEKALTYLATSTSYQLSTAGNPQLFTVMSTFTASNYPEGRLSLAYMSSPYWGQGLRCVKDHDIDFYAKYDELMKPSAE